MAIITNGVITLGAGADMRLNTFNVGGRELWIKTDDTITYKDPVSGNTKSFILKNLAWTLSTIVSGTTTTLQGTSSFTGSDGIIFNLAYSYSVTIGISYATANVDIISSTELNFMRGTHLGRATVNTGTNSDKVTDRKPVYSFRKDKEIDYLEYTNDTDLQAVWSGTVTPIIASSFMGGNSTSAMELAMSAGTHSITRSITTEDWSDSNTLFAGINAIALIGVNHKIRLKWVSNGITYFSKFRTIDEGEPFKTNWRVFHLRHFYLDILTGIDKSSVTEFGFEIVTDGMTVIIDEIWRFTRQDILSNFLSNQTDFYDNLPFFNTNVPWDRRQCEETFALAYADETSISGNIEGVGWVGRFRPTSDIVKIELDKALNSNPLSIGGQIKYVPEGLTLTKWKAEWFILPFVANTPIETMFSSVESLYNTFLTDLNFTTPSNAGLGETSVQPYIWNGLEDPLNVLIPKLRRYANAGVTDLIIPMGNSGWGSWKSRVWRYDIANTLKEKGDDRLNFILNAWIDPLFPSRRVLLESTIFDNHWLKDERDEITIFSDVTQGQDRIFVYAAADARELYIKRALTPIDPTWFDNQIVDGVTYVFSYQYPRFRPSLAHISNTGSSLGKDINIHDRWLQRIDDVVKGYNISGIVISEWFWYTRGFDITSLSDYNTYRTGQSLDVLSDFDRVDNNLPAANGSNEYIADDITLWNWKNTKTTQVISAIKTLLTPRNLKLWISSNVDNIIAVENSSSPVWSSIGMQNSSVQSNKPVPIGNKAFTYNNSRHGTEFNNLNDDNNLDAIWAWNYWGFSRIEAIFEFIQKYCPKKNKISMVLGVFPGRQIPSATDLQTNIITAKTYGMRISFAGDRNYSEAHFLAMEAGMASNPTILSCPVTVTKKKVVGKRKFSNLYTPWDDDNGNIEEDNTVF